MSGILIVDDVGLTRNLLKKMLEQMGYKVAGEAADGDEALLLYERLKPSLVMMDITMPGMDGIEALRRIKELDPNGQVVMCSAMGQQKLIIEAIECGARDFVCKPYHRERIAWILSKMVEQEQNRTLLA